jgi:CRISPR-associated protein Csy2
MIGFKGISPLYEGKKLNTIVIHDIPSDLLNLYIVLVNGVVHRIQNLSDLIWRYHIEDEWYLCQQKQNFQANIEPIEQPQPALDDGSFNFDFN